MVDGQSAQVSKGAAAQLTAEGNRHAVMLALVLRQIPGVLEGPVALRAVERSLPGVRQLVPLHIRRTGERLPARFTRQRLLSAETQKNAIIPLRTSLCVSFREKLDGGKYLIRAGRRWRVFLPCETSVHLSGNALHVEVRRTADI